jgi:hypothetical protein
MKNTHLAWVFFIGGFQKENESNTKVRAPRLCQQKRSNDAEVCALSTAAFPLRSP